MLGGGIVFRAVQRGTVLISSPFLHLCNCHAVPEHVIGLAKGLYVCVVSIVSLANSRHHMLGIVCLCLGNACLELSLL